MQPTVSHASTTLATELADTLVVAGFLDAALPTGDARDLDDAMHGAITALRAGGDFTGAALEVAVLYPGGSLPARRVVVVGLGARDTCSPETLRRAAAKATARAAELGAEVVATDLHRLALPGGSPAAVAQAVVEGALRASYRFADSKRRAPPARAITAVRLLDGDSADQEVRDACDRAAIVARAVHVARDLVNQPPNVANPAYLAAHARALAERLDLALEVGDLRWAEERGMGAFAAVSYGSANEPAFIVLEYNVGRDDLPTIALVGKGVTFDSGGLSLKTRDGMITMKNDMAGAAAVLGAVQAVAELGLPVHLVGICPCVENMPDGAAYRPSDVLVASNGVSIEIHSTDAEGRLALADALVYAGRYRPAAVVDIATLTGASITALGSGVSSSLFASDDGLAAQLEEASEATGERVWRMPLFDEYRETIDAKVAADLKNSGGASGGVGTAAVFLQAFTDYPWAHVDMAGMGLVDTVGSKHYLTRGGTGYGVRLLVEYVRRACA